MHTNRAYAESSTAAHLNVCHMKIANPGKTNRISHKDKLKEKNRKKERRQRIKGNVGKFLKKKLYINCREWLFYKSCHKEIKQICSELKWKFSLGINDCKIILMLVCFVENERKYEGEKDLRDSCAEYH